MTRSKAIKMLQACGLVCVLGALSLALLTDRPDDEELLALHALMTIILAFAGIMASLVVPFVLIYYKPRNKGKN